jgi:signal transduction histidine kinase
MRFRTWPVAALGLAGLLLLVIVSVLTATRRAQDIYTQMEGLNAHHREVDAKLRRLRSDVHLSSIFVRDYLLDSERERAQEYRLKLAEFRRTNMATLAELQRIAPSEDARISSLQTKLDEYWQAFEPLFDWTTAEKMTQSFKFLRREVVPRREAVLAIAQEIEQLNNANLATQRAEVTQRFESFRAGLYRLLWQTLLIGLVVALTAVIRLRMLERRAEEQRSIAEEAERQMRQLSQQLVATQEQERKKLSRELHDHVGQMLTGLRMELGRLERASGPGALGAPTAITECRQLVDNMVRTVRDLALGLRPSMLDDFGLQPALEWLVRDVSRRHGVTVDLTASGDFDHLPDQHRTCVYRVVQEALTNCVRHARASRIAVTVKGSRTSLEVSISDNGVGFDRLARPAGLGLRGIEERARELSGVVHVRSSKGVGTLVTMTLPVPEPAQEVAVAGVAG